MLIIQNKLREGKVIWDMRQQVVWVCFSHGEWFDGSGEEASGGGKRTKLGTIRS